jgi:hypothetical protein
MKAMSLRETSSTLRSHGLAGTGTFFLSGEAAKRGDYPKSAGMCRKGLEEMAAAVVLAPDKPAVMIRRGAPCSPAAASFRAIRVLIC